MAEAIKYIGVARMAGLIETGEENTKALIKAGRAKLAILAFDTSPAAKRRAEGYVYETNVPLIELPYTKEQISAIAGRPGCSMAAFTDLGLASSFASALCAEYGEKYASISERLEQKHRRARERKTGKGRKRA